MLTLARKYKPWAVVVVLLTLLVEMRVQGMSTEACLGALIFSMFYCAPDLFFSLLYSCKRKPPRI